VTFEFFNDGDNPIMAAHPQIIALGNIVGQDDPRTLADSREDGEQDSAFKGLRLIDNDETVVK
jgi:hypothetical protein